MASLLLLGLAILGLGCTVPLTVGGSELDPTIVPPPDDAGTQPDPGVDAGPGPSDSGVPVVDAGVIDPADGGQDAGVARCIQDWLASSSYTNCCSLDNWEGFCTNWQGWHCDANRLCFSDAGVCNSTGHTCSSYSDCCSADCYLGHCANTSLASIITVPTQGPPRACTTVGSCNTYSDCCSQNCFLGSCALPPAPSGRCIPLGSTAGCGSFSDCCSLECKGGQCTDSTLIPQLRLPPSMISTPRQFDAVHNMDLMAPRLQTAQPDTTSAPMR